MQKIINRGFTLIELLVVIAIIGILASIVLVSLNSARGGANDAKIKEQMSSLQTGMEAYYAVNNNYGPLSSGADGCAAAPAAPWNDANSGLVNLADEDNYPAGNGLTCINNSTAAVVASVWAAQARLGGGTGNFYCVDSTGLKRETGASMITAGSDYSCN
jgi:prepilin-type N-terminal cleavage/methylation domain-containing protein